MKRMLSVICAIFLAAVVLHIAQPVSAANLDQDYNDKIRQICLVDKRIKEVEAVVVGNTAGVALRCDTIYFQEDINQVKSFVIKEVKREFPSISKLYVSMDMDIFLRVKKISAKLKQGESILSLRKQLMELVKLYEKRS